MVAKPIPLHGQVEEDVMAYRSFRARLPEAEKNAPVIVLADRVAARAALLAETDAAFCAALAGRDGIRSLRFWERVRRANRDKLIPFPRDEEPENAA